MVDDPHLTCSRCTEGQRGVVSDRNGKGFGTGKAVLDRACRNQGWHADLMERRRAAFELRQMRLPYRKIAEQLGISVGRAYEDVQAVLHALLPVEDAEHLRRMEADNLDRCEAVLLDRFAAKGELAVLDRILAVHARRAKLLGLDSPTKVTGTVEHTHTIAAPDQVQALRDELAERRERHSA